MNLVKYFYNVTGVYYVYSQIQNFQREVQGNVKITDWIHVTWAPNFILCVNTQFPPRVAVRFELVKCCICISGTGTAEYTLDKTSFIQDG